MSVKRFELDFRNTDLNPGDEDIIVVVDDTQKRWFTVHPGWARIAKQQNGVIAEAFVQREENIVMEVNGKTKVVKQPYSAKVIYCFSGTSVNRNERHRAAFALFFRTGSSGDFRIISPPFNTIDFLSNEDKVGKWKIIS